MLTNVRYRLHNPARKKLQEAENVVQRFMASPRGRLEISVHEASHKQIADELGLTSYYVGPAIEQEEDDFGITLGGVRLVPSEIDKLPTKELARLLVSGHVGERVLLQSTKDHVWSQDDFTSFVFSGRDTPSQLIGIYKTVEEQMVEELRADLNRQQALIHEAAVFECQIWPELVVESVKV